MKTSAGICDLSIVPLRSEPAHRSEMISQLLFGERYEVLEEQENWLRIQLAHDGYQGWMERKQFQAVSEEEWELFSSARPLPVETELALQSDKGQIRLVAGAFVPEPAITIGGRQFKPEKDVPSAVAGSLEQTCLYYLNAPYLWGGRSIWGIDCSGFSQMVFRQFGLGLKRDAWQQAEQGSAVDFVQQAQAGDLAFFDNEEGRITHVGILLDGQRIIHASGRVRIDRLDNQGIFDEDRGQYTHKLRIIKRFNLPATVATAAPDGHRQH